MEVNDGVCWSLKSLAFVKSPIKERHIGKVSLWAFCMFDPDKEADPNYFRKILENSLSASFFFNISIAITKQIIYNHATNVTY